MKKRVQFALKQLGIRHKLKLKVKEYDEKNNLGGSAYVNGTYWVFINKKLAKKYASVSEVLFHEAVHIAQMVRGDLCPDTHMWKGGDYSHLPYLWKPWEIEARGMVEALLESWDVHKGRRKRVMPVS